MLLGVPLLRAGLPPDPWPWQLRRALKSLARRGVRRVLLPPGFPWQEALERTGLRPVSALALCRALAPRLAMALLAGLSPRQRVVLLRAGAEDRAAAAALAEALCPQVGQLLTEPEDTAAALAPRLRQRFGAVLLPAGRGPEPQVVMELSPGWEEGGKTGLRRLKLWGTPELSGLRVGPAEQALPPGVDALSLTALLWETGRLEIGQILVSEGASPLDIT